ncbi:RNA-binding (RRM/RBD/RNP motifs) family protein [Wolffia australiana]
MGSVVEDEQKAYAEFREKVRRTVFIDCLSPAATAPVVKAAIGQFGKVLSVRIVPKLPEAAEGGSLPQGALVEMETAARAKAVLQATGDMPFMISGMPRPISPMPATEDMFSDRPRNPDRPRIAARWLDDPADPDLPAAQRLRQLAAKHARERAAMLQYQLEEEEKLEGQQKQLLRQSYDKYELIQGIMQDGSLRQLASYYNIRVGEDDDPGLP